MAVFDMLLALRRSDKGEEMWLRALYPWIFGHAFFEAPENIEIALEAALGYPHAQTADAMAQQIEAFRNFRPKAQPKKISSPALMLYAEQDLLIPPQVARPSFADLPNMTEATIDAAGHSIIWDAPNEVATHLLEFLDKHPIRSPA
jgi:pimeloyl-ACP methyl ester carboxylesterase